MKFKLLGLAAAGLFLAGCPTYDEVANQVDLAIQGNNMGFYRVKACDPYSSVAHNLCVESDTDVTIPMCRNNDASGVTDYYTVIVGRNTKITWTYMRELLEVTLKQQPIINQAYGACDNQPTDLKVSIP